MYLDLTISYYASINMKCPNIVKYWLMQVLPADIIKLLFDYLDAGSFCNFIATCKRFLELAKEKKIIKKLDYSLQQRDCWDWAVKYQHTDIVVCLLWLLEDHGKPLVKYIGILLDKSIDYSSYKIVKYLLNRKLLHTGDITEERLRKIINKGDLEMFTLLHESFKDRNYNTAWKFALEKSRLGIVNYLHKTIGMKITVGEITSIINRTHYALLEYVIDNFKLTTNQRIELLKSTIKNNATQPFKIMMEKFPKLSKNKKLELISLCLVKTGQIYRILNQ